jgi:hypothetical protein
LRSAEKEGMKLSHEYLCICDLFRIFT